MSNKEQCCYKQHMQESCTWLFAKQTLRPQERLRKDSNTNVTYKTKKTEAIVIQGVVQLFVPVSYRSDCNEQLTAQHWRMHWLWHANRLPSILCCAWLPPSRGFHALKSCICRVVDNIQGFVEVGFWLQEDNTAIRASQGLRLGKTWQNLKGVELLDCGMCRLELSVSLAVHFLPAVHVRFLI